MSTQSDNLKCPAGLIEVSFQEKGNYLATELRGEFDLEALRESFTAIRDRAMQTETKLILIDAFGLSAPKTKFDRFRAGEAAAELLPLPMKVAALYRAELITKFAENTAVNRGAEVLVCSDRDIALQWLLEDLPDKTTGTDGE